MWFVILVCTILIFILRQTLSNKLFMSTPKQDSTDSEQNILTEYTNDKLYPPIKSLHNDIDEMAKEFDSYSIGKSYREHNLWVIDIKPDDITNIKTHVRFVGNMHGNEKCSVHTLYLFTKELVSGIPELGDIMQHISLSVLLSLNPDGYMEGIRFNSNNIDLNRNFSSVNPEQETIAFQSWVENNPCHVNCSFHDGAVVVCHPHDQAIEQSDKHMILRKLAEGYTKGHSKLNKNLTTPSIPKCKNGVVQGSHWYPITGSMDDWLLQRNELPLTIELHPNKNTTMTEAQEYYKNFHRSALINLLKTIYENNQLITK